LVIGLVDSGRHVIPKTARLSFRKERTFTFKATYGDLSDENLDRYEWILRGFDSDFTD